MAIQLERDGPQAATADNLRIFFREQAGRFESHFPSRDEVALASGIFKKLKPQRPDYESLEDFKSIAGFAFEFNVFQDVDEVLWRGVREEILPYHMTNRGRLVIAHPVDDWVGYGAPAYALTEVTQTDEIVEAVGKDFIFDSNEEMQERIESWRYARGLIQEYAVRLGIKS